jgi:hypothetical protein
VHCASNSSSGLGYFSSISAKACAFLRLDVVKLAVCRAPHTGFRTFVIVALPGHGNFMVLVALKFSCNGIRTFIIVAVVC